jgi:hypothetical protein
MRQRFDRLAAAAGCRVGGNWSIKQRGGHWGEKPSDRRLTVRQTAAGEDRRPQPPVRKCAKSKTVDP